MCRQQPTQRLNATVAHSMIGNCSSTSNDDNSMRHNGEMMKRINTSSDKVPNRRNSRRSSTSAAGTLHQNQSRQRNKTIHRNISSSSPHEIVVQHNYQDRSNVDDVMTSSLLGSPYTSSLASALDCRFPGTAKIPFPVKLHHFLSQAERDGLSHIISWQEHGRCFVIHQPKPFKEKVLQQYMNLGKLTSFTRQLNLYGFRRLTAAGKDRGGYYHEYFLRGKIHLCQHIVRTKIKGTGVRPKSNPEAEPNFWKMTWVREGNNLEARGTSSSSSTHITPIENTQTTVTNNKASSTTLDNQELLSSSSSSSLLDPTSTASYHWLSAPPLLYDPAASAKKKEQEGQPQDAQNVNTSTTTAVALETGPFITDCSANGDSSSGGIELSSCDSVSTGELSSSWLRTSCATPTPTSLAINIDPVLSCSSLFDDEEVGESTNEDSNMVDKKKMPLLPSTLGEAPTPLVSFFCNSSTPALSQKMKLEQSKTSAFGATTPIPALLPPISIQPLSRMINEHDHGSSTPHEDPVRSDSMAQTHGSSSAQETTYTLFGKPFQAMDTLPMEQLFSLKQTTSMTSLLMVPDATESQTKTAVAPLVQQRQQPCTHDILSAALISTEDMALV